MNFFRKSLETVSILSLEEVFEIFAVVSPPRTVQESEVSQACMASTWEEIMRSFHVFDSSSTTNRISNLDSNESGKLIFRCTG